MELKTEIDAVLRHVGFELFAECVDVSEILRTGISATGSATNERC